MEMDRIVQNCSGAIGIADDITIYGATKEEHDRNLDTLMKTTNLCNTVKTPESKLKPLTSDNQNVCRSRRHGVVTARPDLVWTVVTLCEGGNVRLKLADFWGA